MRMVRAELMPLMTRADKPWAVVSCAELIAVGSLKGTTG